VTRASRRMMGPDGELDDVVHDIFVRALESPPRLRDPSALKSWLFGITVRTVRIRFQKRTRQRWLRFVAPEHAPEQASVPVTELGRDSPCSLLVDRCLRPGSERSKMREARESYPKGPCPLRTCVVRAGSDPQKTSDSGEAAPTATASTADGLSSRRGASSSWRASAKTRSPGSRPIRMAA
jgi:hypothetical protein